MHVNENLKTGAYIGILESDISRYMNGTEMRDIEHAFRYTKNTFLPGYLSTGLVAPTRCAHLKQLLSNGTQNARREAAIFVLLEVIVQGLPKALKYEAAVTHVLQLREHLYAKRCFWVAPDTSLPLIHVPEDLRFDEG